MVTIQLFFIPFLLSYLGKVLGKITDYELKELNSKINWSLRILLLIFYSLMFYFTGVEGKIVTVLLLVLLIVFYFYLDNLHNLHDVTSYISSFVLLNNIGDEAFKILFLLVFAIFMKNSIKDLYLSRELISLAVLVLFYILMIIV